MIYFYRAKVCTLCGKLHEGTDTNLGLQHDLEGKPALLLFNCGNCQTTLAVAVHNLVPASQHDITEWGI